MGRKIFVSYKYSDCHVQPNSRGNSARAYVDHLIKIFECDEIYKGEYNEDLSEFKKDTIKNRLKNKIHDSSITIVLISKGMKQDPKPESDQFIPWEISYSLKEITRSDKTSHTNAVLAVVLPDKDGSYEYYIEDDTCTQCHCITLNTDTLFQILRDNMFNVKDPTFSDCPCHTQDNPVYIGESSYILSVKWQDFISNMEHYLKISTDIRDDRKSYEIINEIES